MILCLHCKTLSFQLRLIGLTFKLSLYLLFYDCFVWASFLVLMEFVTTNERNYDDVREVKPPTRVWLFIMSHSVPS